MRRCGLTTLPSQGAPQTVDTSKQSQLFEPEWKFTVDILLLQNRKSCAFERTRAQEEEGSHLAIGATKAPIAVFESRRDICVFE
jgi:hypothetical protein